MEPPPRMQYQSSLSYDMWSPLDMNMDLTDSRVCVDLGIHKHSHVSDVIAAYRRRH